MKIYLLDLTELNSAAGLNDFCRKAGCRVDTMRREKAERIRSLHEKALSLGAGLLLQWMAAEIPEEDSYFSEPLCRPKKFTASELLEKLEMSAAGPAELSYHIGEHGKPEIVNVPLHFSLAHSGDYVLCAVSEHPVGADIQQIRADTDIRKLAKRFFPEKERDEVLAAADETARRETFFRLWTRREAYAKLTGEGLPLVLAQEFPPDVEWLSFDAPQGYACCICRKKQAFL